jgi:outer membrane protein
MRPSVSRVGLWLAVASLLPATLEASESLSQAWSKALAADAGLAAVTFEADAAHANERAARAARLPQIEVGASYTKMADAPALSVVTPEFAFVSPRIFNDDDFVMRNAQLSLPIFAGGSLSAAVKAAGAASRAAEADESRARADLKLAVAESYLAVLRSQRALRAAQASVAALEAHLKDVTAMVEVQARANTDLLASRVAASGAKQQLARARLGFATARWAIRLWQVCRIAR